MRTWFLAARQKIKRNTLHGIRVPQLRYAPRYGEEAIKIMKNWFDEHQDHPYPDANEKQMLAKETGLAYHQVKQ